MRKFIVKGYWVGYNPLLYPFYTDKMGPYIQEIWAKNEISAVTEWEKKVIPSIGSNIKQSMDVEVKEIT